MKCTVSAKAFYDALKKVSGALKPNQLLPILEEACVEFTGDKCVITATDLETWMVAEIPAEGDCFSFLFKRTKNVIRACGHYSGKLTVALGAVGKEQRLTLSCGDKAGEFFAQEAKDYPVLPELAPRFSFAANAGEFLSRLNRIRYASTRAEDKTASNGVRFDGTKMWCVDGYRMAVSDCAGPHVDEPFIVPADALQNLKAFGDTEVEFVVGKRLVRISRGGVSLYTRLLETSDRLNPETMIPKPFETYTVDRKQYLAQLKYLAEFSEDYKKTAIRFSNGVLSYANQEVQCYAELALSQQAGIVYGFNLRFMRDALEQFKGEDHVEVRVTGPLSPITLTDGNGNTALMLPVRLKEDRAAA